MEEHISQEDKIGYVYAMFMNLLKAFHSLTQNLLIAKLEAYGFERESFLLINSYLSDRQQQGHVNNSFSFWEKIITGVPQGLD